MKLKTAKCIMAVFCVLTVLFLILCSITKRMLWGYIGVVFAIIAVIFWLIFGRCPNCGRYLGRIIGRHCPHCGEKLD